MTKRPTKQRTSGEADYKSILGDVAGVIEAARRSATRSVNSIITAAYWLIGGASWSTNKEAVRVQLSPNPPGSMSINKCLAQTQILQS